MELGAARGRRWWCQTPCCAPGGFDTARSEELFLNLQPAIRKGNLRAVDVGIKLLDHSARVNGYAAPHRLELTGKDGTPLTLVQLLEAVGPIPDEEAEQEKSSHEEHED